jgi:HK97 family phage portal protein
MVDNVNSYDYKTIGRYPPRVRVTQTDRGDGTFVERTDDSPLLFWFDGKSITPMNRKRMLESFTGAGMAWLERKGKLRHNDYDYAQAFLASEFAFRCINIVASDVDGIRHGVRNKNTQQDAPEHALDQAIVYARRNYQQNLIGLWQKALGVWGEAYIQPVQNLFGLYSGLRWLNPMATEPRIEYGAIAGFDYMAGGAYFFKPRELIFDKVDSLLDDIRGQSKIAVALDAINVDREIKRYTLDTLLKDMRMAGILTGRQGSGLTQTDLDSAVAKLKEQQGSRLIAIAPALEYQKVQQEIDGSQLQLSEDARRRIAAALGVPMSIAGAWDSATYQSAPEQKRFYYESVIFRECERHARVMNEVVMPFFDPSGQFEFYYDTDSVASLLEDKAAKAVMVNSRLQAGNLTINQAREAMGDEKIDGGDVLLIPSGYTLMPVAQLAAIAQQQVATLPPGDAPAAMAVDAVAVPEAAPVPGLMSACLMLKLGAQPDLLALQNRVKQLLAGDEVTWNEPDTFHITLVYAPAVTDEQMAALTAALETVELPELSLRVGSLRTFDNLGEYAVHFQIRRNAGLLDFQETLYGVFESVGIPLSAYSKPEAYKPHITVGYAKSKPRAVVFEGKLTVTPVGLELTEGNNVVWQRGTGDEPQSATAAKGALLLQLDVGYIFHSPHSEMHCKDCRWFSDQPDTMPCHVVVNAPQTILADGWCKRWEAMPGGSTVNAWVEDYDPANPNATSIQAAALDEMDAWQKKTRNKSVTAPFKTYLIRDEIADAIRFGLTEAAGDRDATRAVFERAQECLAYKAIQATRIDFEDAFTDVLNEARAGNLTRTRWASITRQLIRTYGARAFRDGLAEGGVDDDPDESEQETIASLIQEQSQYVTNLGAKLFKDENAVSDAMAEQKPALWWNGSIAKFYSAGLLSANANGMFTWVLGRTEKHCDTCKALDGQRRRYKTWYRQNLIAGTVGQDTDCEGWKCDCDLKRSAGKSSMGALPEEHEHHD